MVKKSNIEKALSKSKVIPVIIIDDDKKALPLAEALFNSGITCAEITLRTGAAIESLKIFSQFNKFTLGAGTITNIEQLHNAINAGAEFIVSPGFDETLAIESLKNNIQYIPGCITPTEIQKAKNNSIHLLKFFPSEPYGGINTLKTLSAPFSDISFIPTGGIKINNIRKYLNLNCVSACGMTEIVDRKLIINSDFDTIAKLSKRVIDKISI
jgi:2-dehydro-3-deoxyphosphogluconate aldolase/(4S)-4-hydroxy-2-oxoglutarate aldolase|tara:strand:+ start:407 stop:1042 length:636 start_codon:yes stop_codon:yes gene_type:complete